MVSFPGFPALLLLVSMHLSLFLLSFRRTEPRTMPLSPIKSGVSSSTTSLRNSWALPASQEAMPGPIGSNGALLEEESERPVTPVSDALPLANHWLIRGLAGSSKTTLLKWIAVQAATQGFTGPLTAWNTLLPFYIRLRQHVQRDLPTPEIFPLLISPAIAEMMPPGWVHSILTAGQALILVDGVDEPPERQRENVRTWLNDLVGAYPQAHFIITSRPHAISEGWLDVQHFADAELQPLGLADMDAFIDHWHAAVQEEIQHPEEMAQLEPLAQQLKADIRRYRPLRNLAATPLLCAMLCAMNRDRRQNLPSDRIELYEACCSMLLERRDKEQQIPLSDYPSLSYRQKRAFLEDFAYWLMINEWTEVEVELADERFQRKLQNMPETLKGTSGTAIRKLFVERTGMLREPMAGRIDFPHRTFEEYLAAQAVVDEGDIGVLVKNAHDDQWRELIILACGHAAVKERENLIKKILARGDKEKEHRYQLHLLAISCLETAAELGQAIRTSVQKR